MQLVNHRAHKPAVVGHKEFRNDTWASSLLVWASLATFGSFERHLAVFTAAFLFVPFPMGELLLGLTFWNKWRREQKAFAVLEFKQLHLCFSVCKRQSTCANQNHVFTFQLKPWGWTTWSLSHTGRLPVTPRLWRSLASQTKFLSKDLAPMGSPSSNGYWRRGTTSILSSKGEWQGKQKEVCGSRVSGIWAVLPPCSQGLFWHEELISSFFIKDSWKLFPPANLWFSYLSLFLQGCGSAGCTMITPKLCHPVLSDHGHQTLLMPPQTFEGGYSSFGDIWWMGVMPLRGGRDIHILTGIPIHLVFHWSLVHILCIWWWECLTCRPGTVSRCVCLSAGLGGVDVFPVIRVLYNLSMLLC